MVSDLTVAAESIETLCTVEMRERGSSYGVIRRLYESAREAQGGSPTGLATRGLLDCVNEGDVVIVATGAYVPDYLPKGETDGPTGAASLAYALRLGFGATPLILCEESIVEPVEACCRAIGLGVRSLQVAQRIPYSAAVDTFPVDESAEKAAKVILEDLQPKAIICVEKLGVNSKGVAHSSTGLPAMEGRARMEVLVCAARNANILTIGIGDNGNEIGFGLIEEAVREHKPYGRQCRCSCGGGIACETACDVLITAAVSNWGAYGLTACLAVALEQPPLIHDSQTELRMIHECVRAGAADGATGMYTVSVDGIPGTVHGHIVDMLRVIVEKNLRERKKRDF
jgi:hypothetical protein